MENNNQEQLITKALLIRFLENQCNPQEVQAVSEWLKRKGSDQVLHEILTEQWQDKIHADQPEEGIDPQMQHWKQHIRQLTNEADQQTAQHANLVLYSKKPFVLKYAAVWLPILFAAASTFLFLQSRSKHQQLASIAMIEKRNLYGQRSIVTLPDSSKVYLGAGSTVRFPASFRDKSTRDIQLEGEAFFEVVHKEKQAFIVHSADVQTCVLGTSFKIEAFKNRPVNVSVATGKVSVGKLDKTGKNLQSLAILLPGQNVSWNPVTQKLLNNSLPVTELEQWKMGNLVFNHTNLKMMAEDLERWYKVKISINNPDRAREKISGIIPPNISVIQAMKVLSMTGHFKYRMKDSVINIY